MSIVRVQKRDTPFVQIDKTGIEDRNLSPNAVAVLAYLLSKPDGWQVRVTDIQNRYSKGKDWVQSAFSELRKYGYAELKTSQDLITGKMAGREWVIYEIPTSQQQNIPTTGKTVCRKNRPSGNPLHSNNKKGSNNYTTPAPARSAQAGVTDDEGYYKKAKASHELQSRFIKDRGIPIDKYLTYLNDFREECQAKEKTHSNYPDYCSHFLVHANAKWKRENRPAKKGGQKKHPAYFRHGNSPEEQPRKYAPVTSL